MGKRFVIAAAAVVLATSLASIATGSPPVVAATTQGVTASTIRIGIPYVDFAAVRAIGVNLDPGNYSDAYKALIANMNAHGGILGRHIVAYLVAVNPVAVAPSATSCTQLTQDDQIFVSIAPLMPDCYLADNVPTINGSGLEQKTSSPGWAPNFTLTPPSSAYDPLQLNVFSKLGAFKGKKVGLFGGDTTDKSEVAIVDAALKKLHVDVTQTAIDAAPEGDDPAAYAQAAVIAERFQSAGVNEVVAVGDGSATWPDALNANQSSYNPPWVATNSADLNGYLEGANNPTYVKNLDRTTPSSVGDAGCPKLRARHSTGLSLGCNRSTPRDRHQQVAPGDDLCGAHHGVSEPGAPCHDRGSGRAETHRVELHACRGESPQRRPARCPKRGVLRSRPCLCTGCGIRRSLRRRHEDRKVCLDLSGQVNEGRLSRPMSSVPPCR